MPILGFLGLSVLELGRGTRQTDRHRPSYEGRGHNNKLAFKYAQITDTVINAQSVTTYKTEI